MSTKQLLDYIDLFLADGAISAVEENLIYQKAKSINIDKIECEAILTSKIQLSGKKISNHNQTSEKKVPSKKRVGYKKPELDRKKAIKEKTNNCLNEILEIEKTMSTIDIERKKLIIAYYSAYNRYVELSQEENKKLNLQLSEKTKSLEKLNNKSGKYILWEIVLSLIIAIVATSYYISEQGDKGAYEQAFTKIFMFIFVLVISFVLFGVLVAFIIGFLRLLFNQDKTKKRIENDIITINAQITKQFKSKYYKN